MKRLTKWVVAGMFMAAMTAVVADDAFARGGGSGGSGGGSGGPSGGGGAAAGAPAGAPAGDSGTNGGDAASATTGRSSDVGALAFPRENVAVRGCSTTSFGAAGGIAPCPSNP